MLNITAMTTKISKSEVMKEAWGLYKLLKSKMPTILFIDN